MALLCNGFSGNYAFILSKVCRLNLSLCILSYLTYNLLHILRIIKFVYNIINEETFNPSFYPHMFGNEPSTHISFNSTSFRHRKSD